jgi:hypothetical protein
MMEGRGVHGVLVGDLRERNHLGDPDVDAVIIIRRVFKKKVVGVWTGLSWLRIETGEANL